MMVDFESEESLFLSFSTVWQEKKFYGENFWYRKNICEIWRAGGCCSNREPPDQIEMVGMFDFENIIHRSFVDMFSLTVLLLVILFFFTFCLSSQLKNNKRFNVQKTIFHSKEKRFLKISLLVQEESRKKNIKFKN